MMLYVVGRQRNNVIQDWNIFSEVSSWIHHISLTISAPWNQASHLWVYKVHKFIQRQRATSSFWWIHVTWINVNQTKRSVKLVSANQTDIKSMSGLRLKLSTKKQNKKTKKPDLFIYSKDTPNQKSFGFKPFQQICISIIYLQTVNNMQNCVVKSSATAHG